MTKHDPTRSRRRLPWELPMGRRGFAINPITTSMAAGEWPRLDVVLINPA